MANQRRMSSVTLGEPSVSMGRGRSALDAHQGPARRAAYPSLSPPRHEPFRPAPPPLVARSPVERRSARAARHRRRCSIVRNTPTRAGARCAGADLALLCSCARRHGTLPSSAPCTNSAARWLVLDANDWLSSAVERVPDAARMLGRLYDAIDCCDLPAPLVEQIEAHSGVPVFNGVARPEHPLRQLIVDARAAQGALPAAPSADEQRRALQALIVCGTAVATPLLNQA